MVSVRANSDDDAALTSASTEEKWSRQKSFLLSWKAQRLLRAHMKW